MRPLNRHRYEVVVVDDGSSVDSRSLLADLTTRYRLRIERQVNAGAAVARQRGAVLAQGVIVVVLDDDMRVAPTFLEQHLKLHGDEKTVVLGRLRPDAKLRDMPLFERFFASVLARKAEAFAGGQATVQGHDVYTGNLSLRREFFLDVGGFDPQFLALEDEELGIRLEKAGARFVFANDAASVHSSDWVSTKAWMARARRDGAYQVKVSRKHPDHAGASPWRHVSSLSRLSRPLIALGLAVPSVGNALSGAAMRTATALDKVGLEPAAIAGATFVYGVQYYCGVREETVSIAKVASDYHQFKKRPRRREA